MAMSWCVGRAAASSWLIRSAASSLNRVAFSSASSSSLFASRFLPFSTFSADASSFNSPNSKPTASDKLSLLDGLPFDSMKEHREDGIIFLRRKTEHQIISIIVSRYDTVFDQDSFIFPYDADVNNDFYSDDDIGVDDGEVDEEDSESSEVVDNEEYDDAEYDDDNEVPRITMLVKILHGDNFDRCLEFLCRAFPKNPDKILIQAISFRKTRKRGEPVGPDHLDEFEDFFKQRGIEAKNFDFLINYAGKLNQLNESRDVY